MHRNLTTASEKQTEELAAKIGAHLKGGEVIELTSDIGGGKTAFTRGLAHGAGSQNQVSSPTFTIANLYKTPKFNIHHLDFYRLSEPGLIEHELAEHLEEKRDVIVIEWSDVVAHVLPESRLRVQIKATGEDERQFEFNCPETLGYLLDVDTKS